MPACADFHWFFRLRLAVLLALGPGCLVACLSLRAETPGLLGLCLWGTAGFAVLAGFLHPTRPIAACCVSARRVRNARRKCKQPV